jgi:hypothetical protein
MVKIDPNRSMHCVFQMSGQANISVIRYVAFVIIPICLSRQKKALSRLVFKRFKLFFKLVLAVDSVSA